MKITRHYLAVILLSSAFLFDPSCHNGQSADQQASAPAPKDSLPIPATVKDPTIPGNFSSQTKLHFDSPRITAFLKRYPDFAPFRKDMQKFYADRRYAYAWYDKGGLIEPAENLYNRIININREGLPDKISYKDTLTNIFNDEKENLNKPNPETELMLTAQYFQYIKLAWGGLSESQTRAMNWFLPRKKLDLPTLMDSLLSDRSVSAIRHEYVYRQYGLLRKYLKKYREIEAQKDWPTISSSKKTLAVGDSARAVGQMRKKLFQFGDLAENSGSDVFDTALESALQGFQRRMGMKDDGVAGPGTISELNKPLTSYIRTIMVNMERSRWVPVSLDRDYLIVNIPAFQLYLFNKDSLLFSMNVVVGKSVHKTVIFNGNLQYVVFSPYWNVPSGILRNEVLPGIRRDKSYLSRHNMEYSDGRVRQRPGPANPLGQVKFLFPNQYDIYLHDSPSKGLFNETTRAFSHGCIRIAEARKLALYLLRNDPAWPVPKIDEAMKAGKEKWVTLKDQLPVFIAYFTAWVDSNGKLNQRKDLYNRDSRLAEALWGGNKK